MQDCQEREEFRKLADYPDYSISNLGRVRRDTTRTNAKAGSFLKTASHERGYAIVSLMNRDAKAVCLMVHQLVCRAFHGDPVPPANQVAHYDGDPTNNHADNLRWVTNKENADDRDRHGRTLIGVRCPQAKLTEDDVKEIRHLRARGMKLVDIADHFPIAWGSIGDVVSRRTWKHVP